MNEPNPNIRPTETATTETTPPETPPTERVAPVETTPPPAPPAPPAPPPRARRGGPDPFLKRFVVIVTVLVASIIALAVILVTTFLPAIRDTVVPEEVSNWGGIIVGFYFGTFASLLKDWISGNPDEEA